MILRFVAHKQELSRKATDRKRGAKLPSFRVGDYVRVNTPNLPSKKARKFSDPQLIVKTKGPFTYVLEDGRVWNASKLSACPATLMTPTGQSNVSPKPHVPVATQLAPTRHSTRTRTPPVWAKDYHM